MEKYTSLGDTSFSAEERASEDERIEALEQYNYFDVDRIIESSSLSDEAWKKGRKLFDHGTFSKIRIQDGYEQSAKISGELCQTS